MMCNLLFVTFFNIPLYDMKLPCPLEEPFSFAKFCRTFVLFKGELAPKCASLYIFSFILFLIIYF